ncbi:MAG: pyridoxal-phosphate dependent enzyme, partial [Cyclobacteriaceae bacterium]|nr:pyridoxal-phosphate dependent enzyme [Cyclobacteriaceae bacterium]
MIEHRLSIRQVEEAHAVISPAFIHTPQYICEPLSGFFDCELMIKVETINPIRSFKGRGADYLVSKSTESELICASAGNFGQAMAYACRKAKKKLIVYASVNANPLKIDRMRWLGADVILFGEDFDAAKEEARKISTQRGIRFIEDGVEIETLAGAGTIALELKKAFSSIDILLVALGNGALINGVARIMKEKSPFTKIIAVQAKGAPAMVDSWRAGKLISYEHIDTIADGIGVRLPVEQALQDMKGLVDGARLVEEKSILQAMKLLHEHTGLIVEPSGAVGIAALLENKSDFRSQQVATILC